MEPDPARMLSTLRFARDLARIRQRARWRAKVCTVMFREDALAAKLDVWVAQLESVVKARRRRMVGD